MYYKVPICGSNLTFFFFFFVQICEPVKTLRKCKYFRDVTWTYIMYPDNTTQQVMHCKCPHNSVAYLIKRHAYQSVSGTGYQYSFACSPQTVSFYIHWVYLHILLKRMLGFSAINNLGISSKIFNFNFPFSFIFCRNWSVRGKSPVDYSAFVKIMKDQQLMRLIPVNFANAHTVRSVQNIT